MVDCPLLDSSTAAQELAQLLQIDGLLNQQSPDVESLENGVPGRSCHKDITQTAAGFGGAMILHAAMA